MTEYTTTSNGHEIQNGREKLTLDEFKSVLETYELNGENAYERAEKLRAIDADNLALFLSDVNRRVQGSDDTLMSEKTVSIGDKNTVPIEQRYDLFINLDNKIKTSKPNINPERLGDALALTTVLLHPFKDGNGRTARLMGFLFRDDFDAKDADESFAILTQPRDEAREKREFMINGFIPYMPEGTDQSKPEAVEKYIDAVLSDGESNLYTSPYGQAELLAPQAAEAD